MSVRNPKSIIYIYSGPGASSESIKHVKQTLRNLVDLDRYLIKQIRPSEVICSNWETHASLFIMPGGADLFYLRDLSPKGNNRIRRFVENGGSYLGFCAGSYYAGSRVEFAVGTQLEVVGDRELKFFPGTVQGPILAEYEYNSCSGCRIARLEWQLEKPPPLQQQHNQTLQSDSPFPKGSIFNVFYNGGGQFLNASNKPNTKILASYATSSGDGDDELKPAIIETRVGSGVVILTGPHWEYDYRLLDRKDFYLRKLIPILEKSEQKRLDLARHLLKRLGLQI